MPTDHDPSPFGFAPVEGRAVVAAFDVGAITSNAGALLLGATDRAIGLVRGFASCFRDARMPERTEHEVTPGRPARLRHRPWPRGRGRP
ncbi:transposase [Siccirubricoccus deserti]